jgi:hypothetical protein
MDISYKSERLRALCISKKELTRKFGRQAAEAILNRQVQLCAAANLWEFSNLPPSPRCHELQKRKGKDPTGVMAIRITGALRLLIEPNVDPLPLNADGKLVWEKIYAVTVLSVENYHD